MNKQAFARNFGVVCASVLLSAVSYAEQVQLLPQVPGTATSTYVSMSRGQLGFLSRDNSNNSYLYIDGGWVRVPLESSGLLNPTVNLLSGNGRSVIVLGGDSATRRVARYTLNAGWSSLAQYRAVDGQYLQRVFATNLDATRTLIEYNSASAYRVEYVGEQSGRGQQFSLPPGACSDPEGEFVRASIDVRRVSYSVSCFASQVSYGGIESNNGLGNFSLAIPSDIVPDPNSFLRFSSGVDGLSPDGTAATISIRWSGARAPNAEGWRSYRWDERRGFVPDSNLSFPWQGQLNASATLSFYGNAIFDYYQRTITPILPYLTSRGADFTGWSQITVRDMAADGRTFAGNGTFTLPDGTTQLRSWYTTVGVCDRMDFNADGLSPSDQDLIDFLSVLAGGPCSTNTCNDIDFNNDGLFPSDDDLVAFLRVLSGGSC